jgi:hypothetical protein
MDLINWASGWLKPLIVAGKNNIDGQGRAGVGAASQRRLAGCADDPLAASRKQF